MTNDKNPEQRAKDLAAGYATRNHKPPRVSTTHLCKCGRTISGNKALCLDCRTKETLGI
jgi:hypothetical protein